MFCAVVALSVTVFVDFSSVDQFRVNQETCTESRFYYKAFAGCVWWSENVYSERLDKLRGCERQRLS